MSLIARLTAIAVLTLGAAACSNTGSPQAAKSDLADTQAAPAE